MVNHSSNNSNTDIMANLSNSNNNNNNTLVLIIIMFSKQSLTKLKQLLLDLKFLKDVDFLIVAIVLKVINVL
jgi:hypothetical protein